MGALSSADLAAMRDDIGELLPDSCCILTVTRTPDGQGGSSESWAAGGDIDCRLDMIQGSEPLSGGALQPFTRYILSLPWNTTVTNANRVLHSGVTYSIQSVNNNQSWIGVRRCMLEVVE